MATKKDIIIQLFNEAAWLPHHEGRCKILTYEMFRDNNLESSVEYGQSYCDVIYAKRILQKLGYRVLIGHSVCVYEKGKQPHED